MKFGKIARAAVIACACMMVIGALVGCTAQNSAESEQQAENRHYMSTVNTTVDELSTRLESFEDAVSRGDVVTMRTQADNAFKTIDALAAIEAPEALAEIQKGYTEGSAALKDALNAYVALFTEIESATDEHPFDFSTYDERIKAIQDQYNDGVAKLEAADKKATEL